LAAGGEVFLIYRKPSIVVNKREKGPRLTKIRERRARLRPCEKQTSVKLKKRERAPKKEKGGVMHHPGSEDRGNENDANLGKIEKSKLDIY